MNRDVAVDFCMQVGWKTYRKTCNSHNAYPYLILVINKCDMPFRLIYSTSKMQSICFISYAISKAD